MKIGLVRHLMDEPQGGARLIALLARDLQQLGEEVTLYCYVHDRERCFPELLGEVRVRSVRALRTPSIERGYESGWRRTQRQLRRYWFEARALAAQIDSGTDVLNPHEWLAHRSAALAGFPRRIPVVWTFNDPSRWHLAAPRGVRHLPYRLFGAFDTRQVNRFAAITTLSDWMTGVATRCFTAPVHTLRCGIDASAAVDPHSVRQSIGDADVFRVLSVGILSPPRRFEDALHAMALARQRGITCHYTILGSDRFAPDYARSLRGLVRDLGLGEQADLQFQSVSESALNRAYARIDAVIFPNEQQAWGLAQLEAMARGIPAIISRGAGISEVIRDREHALLVDPRRPEQIADAVIALRSSHVLRQRLGAAGRELVLGSYTSLHYAKQIRELFRDCVDRSVGRLAQAVL